MYVEPVHFKSSDRPVSYKAQDIHNYHLHCHKGVIEILVILEGRAHVKVSFEDFYMSAGDYCVIRDMDSHSIKSVGPECRVLSLHLRMDDFLGSIPHLYYICFACESFDLAAYKNETLKLLQMVFSLLQESESPECDRMDVFRSAQELLLLLSNDYDTIAYYNRDCTVSPTKRQRFYRFMKYIMEDYDKENLHDHIAEKEHYSKSYISHFFKEVDNCSFRSLLDYIRLFKSEIMLLDSDTPIGEISSLCGFSDVKYYIKNFKKWFLLTPSEYRKKYVPEVNIVSSCTDIDIASALEILEKLCNDPDSVSSYRAAVNPLTLQGLSSIGSLKSFGLPDAESALNDKEGTGTHLPDHASPEPHMIFLQLDNTFLEKDNSMLSPQLESMSEFGLDPVFLVDQRGISSAKCKDLITGLLDLFPPDASNIPRIFITYSDLGQYDNINSMISYISDNFGFTKLHPIFIP